MWTVHTDITLTDDYIKNVNELISIKYDFNISIWSIRILLLHFKAFYYEHRSQNKSLLKHLWVTKATHIKVKRKLM